MPKYFVALDTPVQKLFQITTYRQIVKVEQSKFSWFEEIGLSCGLILGDTFAIWKMQYKNLMKTIKFEMIFISR